MTETWRESIGDYHLVREIGRGAFGIVYEATQISLGRQVALKVLPASLFPSKKVIDRFRKEAMAAAQLSHSNIVTVHEAGQDRDLYYFSMEYVAGKSLAQIIAERGGMSMESELEDTDFTMSIEAILAQEGPSPPLPGAVSTEKPPMRTPSREECFFIAAQVLGVAEALQYAHDNGVVHQDVKPSNLVVDRADRLCLLDFGTAQIRRLRDNPDIGTGLATPLYASPEQLDKKRGPVGPQTDVWSLGATLYEWVTIYPPFMATDYPELFRRVLTERPAPPRELNSAVPKDLSAIILKALEREKQDRYVSAQALADDLRHFVGHEPVVPARRGLGHRFVLWHRRSPSLARAVMALVLLSLLSAGGVIYAIRSAETQLEKARGLVTLEAYGEALNFLGQIPSDSSDWPEAMRLKAECLHMEGEDKTLEDHYVLLLEKHADRFETGELLIGKAKTLDDLKRYDEAEQVFERALTAVEGVPETKQIKALAHYELAKFLAERGEDDEVPVKLARAQIKFEETLRLDRHLAPADRLAKAYFAYGGLLQLVAADQTQDRRDQSLQLAEQHIRTAVDLRGADKPKYLAGLAELLLERGSYDAALKEISEAISAARGDPKAEARYQKTAGIINLAAEDYGQAADRFTRAAAELKNDRQLPFLLVKAYTLIKDRRRKASEAAAAYTFGDDAIYAVMSFVLLNNEKELRIWLPILRSQVAPEKLTEILKRREFDGVRESFLKLFETE